jgi:cytochrome P450 family 135
VTAAGRVGSPPGPGVRDTVAVTADTLLPPGPSAPMPWQTLRWMLRPGPFLSECHGRYGDVFTVRIANEQTWVMLAHPDAVREVFTGDPGTLHAGEGNRILLPVVGPSSVLLLDDREHMHQRKLLLPPFHGERMRRYGELMGEIAAEEIGSWPTGEPLRLWPRMQAITLEVIMRAVFGLDAGAQREHLRRPLARMLDWLMRPGRLLAFAALGPERVMDLPGYRRVRAEVDARLYEVIRARRGDTSLAEREDILSMLVQARDEDGRAMSDEDLRDELITLLVAGHETTATSLSWAVERLVRHPAQMARLRDDVLAGEDAYLDAVVKETLRLRPVLPIVARRLTEPWEVAGHRLPAGAAVTPCIWLVHRRPDLYPDPLAFRPERFLERPPGTYTWIPFGGGVRRCIGASFALFEMTAVLAEIVRRVDLEPVAPVDERVARRTITLTPARQAEVVVRRPTSRAPMLATAPR